MPKLVTFLSALLAIVSLSLGVFQLNKNPGKEINENDQSQFLGHVEMKINPLNSSTTPASHKHPSFLYHHHTNNSTPPPPPVSLACPGTCSESLEKNCLERCGKSPKEETDDAKKELDGKEKEDQTAGAGLSLRQKVQKKVINTSQHQQSHLQHQQPHLQLQQHSHPKLQQEQKRFQTKEHKQQPHFMKQKKQQQQQLYHQLLLLKQAQLVSEKRDTEQHRVDPFLNVEGTLRSVHGGQLEAVVSWELKEGVKGNSRGFLFMVFMARETCNLVRGYPHCEETDRMLQRLVKSYSLKASVVFKNLNYNSKYWIEVVFKESRSHRIWINTMPCNNFHRKNFTVCLDNASNPSEPNYLAYKTGSWLKPDILCKHHDKNSDIGYVWLDWTRFNTPSPSEETSAASQLEEAIGDTIGMAKTLATEEITNSTGVENVVMVTFQIKNAYHSQFYHPLSQHICLLVRPDVVYDVKIKSRVGEHDIIFDHIRVNVSRSTSYNATCAALFDKLRDKQQENWAYYVAAVALTVVVVVVVFTSFVMFCGKCRKAHTKLLKKTLLAKNNSYRAAPGASVLYMKEEDSRQAKDEWEIDAREVTLGAEIGLGAFGLVMTGYYRECQVAIKVLKGDVSPSHKDELLREIQMMKNIGSHSNIVSLVGACTLKDPIALIMEYMPFGNLQLFLQKCCIEGELQETDNGAEMTYCPTDHLTGLKELLCITSTDLLSFARQVALAMEFITDKRYVHRDLAARNVLVTTNKVVKLCDFGLTRAVCKGDQYCKLTNGRLPLKWMALESIKDRIFTVQSDVWSFGIFLWEITTFGSTPYPDIAFVDLYRLLSDGYRMNRPQNCSHDLYNLMSSCWLEDPQKRPSFNSIRHQLEMMLAQKENYLDLDHFSSSLPHPKRPSTPCDE